MSTNRRNFIKKSSSLVRNSAVLAHMGNIAYSTGNKLLWDDSKKLFANDDKANAFIKPEYRSLWKFPSA